MSTFPLPTDTVHVQIESRQYELFGVDLGEGIPRIALKVGLVFFLPWLLLCRALGIGLLNGGLLLWLLPPLLFTVAALSRDAGGRLRLVSWGDWASWVLHRARPIVNGDTTPSDDLAPIACDVSFLTVDLPQKGSRADTAA